MADWTIATRIALRELRGGFRALPVLLSCLALGVAAIAGVGAVSESVMQGLRADALALLGGDVELRRTHAPIEAARLEWVRDRVAAVSETTHMRTMVSGGGGDRRVLAELKAVDSLYPLVGNMVLAPAMPLADALADGGAVAEQALLTRLNLDVGDRIDVGDRVLVVRAVIEREPDRLATAFSFGPRLMIARDDLESTGLIQPGSLIRYYARVLLNDGADLAAWVEDVTATFPEAEWRIRDSRNAQPGFQRFVSRLTMYLMLVGLAALIVGGIGVAGAVRAHLEDRTRTIAILKSLGASRRVIFRAYLIQVAIVAAVGCFLGATIGALAPIALAPFVAARLPVEPVFGIYPGPVLRGLAFGLLTALVFTIWPVARACETRAATLFRGPVATDRARPRWPMLVLIGVALAALIALAIDTANDPVAALWFVAAIVVSLGCLRAVAWATGRGARRVRHRRKALSRVVAGFARPGGPLATIMPSLGVGLTVLVAIALVEANLARTLTERLPDQAPAFFFIDIQRDQIDEFMNIARAVDGVGKVEQVPMLRGRVTALNGAPAAVDAVDPGVRWMLRGDIGLTFAATPPPRARLVAGDWWPTDYDGPPLVSFSEEGAAGMGLAVGDRITFSVLGRPIDAEIASLRRIDWGEMGINFLAILSPGVLDGAPYAHVATAEATPAAEVPLVAAIGDGFSNVSAIPVRDLLKSVAGVVEMVADAVRAAAGVTVLAGILVLGGALAADRRRRIYDAVIFKVLGATRAQIARDYLVEFAVLGVLVGAVALALGVGGSWAFITFVMEETWVFTAREALATVVLGIGLTMLVGFLGTWRALTRKPMAVLRGL